MAWSTVLYSKNKVDRAGDLLLVSPLEINDWSKIEEAFAILNNWRASHSFPLNTIQMRLRERATKLSSHAVVAQRLKRVPSIIGKLLRFPQMKLSRMQDVGGCRAVVDTVSQVRQISKAYLSSRSNHILMNTKNYVDTPKESGYRGVHLVYKYHSDMSGSSVHNGRLIEIQLRSKLQHAWATAVETVGTFLDQSLKSSEGAQNWLNFFRLTGSAFSIMEGTAPIPGITDSGTLLRERVIEGERTLQVKAKLAAYGTALNYVEQKKSNAHYFLLSLDTKERRLRVYSFTRDELERANEQYLDLEKEQKDQPNKQAVLVAVDSLSMLRRSYPNYFLDTDLFVKALDSFMHK